MLCWFLLETSTHQSRKDRTYIEKYFIYLDLGDAIPFMEPKTKPMTWRWQLRDLPNFPHC